MSSAFAGESSAGIRAQGPWLRSSRVTCPINMSDHVSKSRPDGHRATVFDVWKEYEKVAMHFNDLIMQLRTRSLGGVATLATIAGVVAHGDVGIDMRREMLVVAFALLCAFWVAIWLLDFLYYNPLLLGAVDALVELEHQSQKSEGGDPIMAGLVLSTRIEAFARSRGRGAIGRWMFYIIVFGCAGLRSRASRGHVIGIFDLRENNVEAVGDHDSGFLVRDRLAGVDRGDRGIVRWSVGSEAAGGAGAELVALGNGRVRGRHAGVDRTRRDSRGDSAAHRACVVRRQ